MAGWALWGLSVLVLGLGLGAGPAWAQSATVRGFVTAAPDGEALPGVNVLLSSTAGDRPGPRYGAVSDADGFFLLAGVAPGHYVLRASFVGFTAYVDTLVIAADDRLLVNIALAAEAVALEEVAVEAARENGAARVTAGLQTVRPEEIALVPAPDLAGDLVSYMSTVPGVVLMGDRGGQVFIRGGEPSHNLTLLDGIEVYQPFHILGFYSAFPADVISQADIYAGGFGSRFSGRLSSVIDVQTRHGSKRAFSAAASLSPFTGSGRLEGPLLRDRISFLGAARLSLLDQLAARYVAAPLPYTFGDVFAKVHMRLGGNHQLAVTGLHTYDHGTLLAADDLLQRSDAIRWRNTALGLRYLVAPQALPMLGEVLVSYARLTSERGTAGAPDRTSYVETINTAVHLTNYARFAEVDWGFYLRVPSLDVGLGGQFQNFEADRYRPTYTGAYLEPEIRVGEGVRVQPGVSLQMYDVKGLFLDPRLRVRWSAGIHHWSAAAGRYRQSFIGLNDRRDATNIFTAWVEAPAGTMPQAEHLLLGYRVTPVPWLEASVEGFYKRMDHLLINAWTPFPSFTTRLQEARGRAAGFDLRLEVRHARFYGFVNYGYASTRYTTVPADAAATRPVSFRPPHDRRHQVNVLATTTLAGFDLSARWQFGSGLPYTPVQGFDGFILMDGAVDVGEVRGFPRVIYDDVPYRAVLPAYHRLDVSVERTFALRGRAQLTVQAGVLNLYDRANLFSLDLFTARRTDQLPFVPIAGLKVER